MAKSLYHEPSKVKRGKKTFSKIIESGIAGTAAAGKIIEHESKNNTGEGASLNALGKIIMLIGAAFCLYLIITGDNPLLYIIISIPIMFVVSTIAILGFRKRQ